VRLGLTETNQPRVVIIGGGFAGLAVARKLQRSEMQVLLLDRNNYHLFQPLLYQVATAGLEPDSIAFPLRKIFKRYRNLTFRMAEVTSVAPAENRVITDIGPIDYDYLVLATGSRTNFFGRSELADKVMTLKSIPEAMELRNLMLENLEHAVLVEDLKEREALMNFVVVGGGPTGVETAGALGELKRHILPRDYPDLDIRLLNVHLLEMEGRLLGGMSEEAGEESLAALKKLGVKVWLDTGLADYDGEIVKLTNGKTMAAQTVIWSAGVEGATLPGFADNLVAKGNRLSVDQFNRVSGFENVFALGDLAAMTSDDLPKGHPLLAPVAIQQGELLGENLVRLRAGKEMQPFNYRDKGALATIGRNRAVADLGRFHFKGIIAWLLWTFIHLMTLVGFRNRMVVFVNWLWNYFTYDRGVRLILKPFDRKIPRQKKENRKSPTSA